MVDEELEWECPVCGEWVTESEPCDCFDLGKAKAKRCPKCQDEMYEENKRWKFKCGCFSKDLAVMFL